MDAAWEPTAAVRGRARLLEDCAVLERLDEARTPARDRLQHVLGYELAGFLLRALVRDYRRRSPDPVA
jgi:hypothetical protein